MKKIQKLIVYIEFSFHFMKKWNSFLTWDCSDLLQVPIANAIFFCGDRVERTGNPVIEKLSDLQKLSEIIVSKFGPFINAWVIEASVFNGPFAVYKDFIPSVNQYGEPRLYHPTGFPASTSTASLLSNCLQEVRNCSSHSYMLQIPALKFAMICYFW